MGEKLAATLNNLIGVRAGEGVSRGDLLTNMADAAGVTVDHVRDILSGSTNCPPPERLVGFARALGVSTDSLMRAAEEDGCTYAKGTSESNFLQRAIDALKSAFSPTDPETASAGELFAPDPDAEHTGLMVGVPLDPEVAEQLAIPGGEPPEALHITLCYCGDIQMLDDATIARVIAEVEALSKRHDPMYGRVGGIGRFNASGTSGGKDVIYANVDVPGLNRLRERLVECLEYAGCPPKKDHGYTPHITLAYVDPGAQSPVETMPTIPLHISKIRIHVGDKTTDFPLVDIIDERNKIGYYYSNQCADPFRLFNHFEFAEPPEWMPLLPKPDTYKHPRYGEIVITRDRNERFVNNINSRVYGQDLPIDAEHETKLSGALGYIKSARLNEDGSADGRAEWTDRGRSLIENNRFKYVSPEWYEEWCDPSTEQCYEDVLIGAALTTRPFFKESALRPLIASEQGIAVVEGEPADPQVINFTASQPKGERIMSDQHPEPQGYAELQATVQSLQTELQASTVARQAAEAQLTQLVEQNKTLAEQNQALAGRIDAMEKSARRDRYTAMANGDKGNRWFGEIASHISLMETLADTFGEDSDQFKAYVQQQQAMAEQIAASDLFKEVGSSRSGGDAKTAAAKLDAATRKLMEADTSLTYAQAYDQALQREPQLYNEYLREEG